MLLKYLLHGWWVFFWILHVWWFNRQQCKHRSGDRVLPCFEVLSNVVFIWQCTIWIGGCVAHAWFLPLSPATIALGAWLGVAFATILATITLGAWRLAWCTPQSGRHHHPFEFEVERQWHILAQGIFVHFISFSCMPFVCCCCICVAWRRKPEGYASSMGKG